MFDFWVLTHVIEHTVIPQNQFIYLIISTTASRTVHMCSATMIISQLITVLQFNFICIGDHFEIISTSTSVVPIRISHMKYSNRNLEFINLQLIYLVFGKIVSFRKLQNWKLLSIIFKGFKKFNCSKLNGWHLYQHD